MPSPAVLPAFASTPTEAAPQWLAHRANRNPIPSHRPSQPHSPDRRRIACAPVCRPPDKGRKAIPVHRHDRPHGSREIRTSVAVLSAADSDTRVAGTAGLVRSLVCLRPASSISLDGSGRKGSCLQVPSRPLSCGPWTLGIVDPPWTCSGVLSGGEPAPRTRTRCSPIAPSSGNAPSWPSTPTRTRSWGRPVPTH